MSEAKIERIEQTGAVRLQQLVPDYQLFGAPPTAPMPWYRQVIEFLEERTSPDVAVLVSVVALAYVDLKVVEMGDRLSVIGVIGVLGVSLLTAVVGFTAYLWRPTNGQNRKKGADPPVDDRPE